MVWWITTVACIIGALIFQYLCSSKILRMKQAISIKGIALRDIREEGQCLDEQEINLKNQQTSLTNSINRLRIDITQLLQKAKDTGLQVAEADFPLEELEEEAAVLKEDGPPPP